MYVVSPLIKYCNKIIGLFNQAQVNQLSIDF